MNIKILGPGCSRCHTLSRMAREVIEELGMVVLQEFDLLEEFRRYGPLVMDKERLTSLGRGLKEEVKLIKSWTRNLLSKLRMPLPISDIWRLETQKRGF